MRSAAQRGFIGGAGRMSAALVRVRSMLVQAILASFVAGRADSGGLGGAPLCSIHTMIRPYWSEVVSFR